MKNKWIWIIVMGSLSLFAQDQAKTARIITGAFDQNEQAPIQIESWTHTTDDYISEITVHNLSDKTIVAFQLGWALFIPNGCGQDPVEPMLGEAMMDRVTIKPSESAETKAYSLRPNELTARLHAVNAVLLHVQIGVLKVDFSDGSVWTNPAENHLFNTAALGLESRKCKDGKLLPSAPANVRHAKRQTPSSIAG